MSGGIGKNEQRSSERRTEQPQGMTNADSLFANNHALHDDAVGQLRALADDRVASNDAALHADLLAHVAVDRRVEMRVGRDEDA